jgi:SulP family sulfate permease
MNIRKIPKNETAVMITSVLITVLTRNLALGVLIGVAMSAIFFSRKIANLISCGFLFERRGKRKDLRGQWSSLFCLCGEFLSSFDFREKLERVMVDLTHAHLWDHSSVDALDKVVLRFRKRGVEVELIGLNEASATLLERLTTHDNSDALDKMGSQ